MAHGPASRSASDRFLTVMNVDEDVLTHDDPSGVCELDGGPALAPETVRRLSCDGATVRLIRRQDGTVLGATDKKRAIRRRVRRMLRARDQGCRFPGCGQRTFVDAHHIRHRAHGGSDDLENLVELCWFHHRLVHEGGWKLRLDQCGNVVVSNPTGNVIPSIPRPTTVTGTINERNADAGLTIDADTVKPRWYGDPLDLDHITTALWCADQPGAPERRHANLN
jgi:hypothetical protein